MKKITFVAVASAAAFSLGAHAAGEQQKQQPQAQGGQMQSQGAAGGMSSPGATYGAQKQEGSAAAGASAGQHDQQTIRQVQEKLSAEGKQLQADGIMGPQTQQALREYQKSKGLEASGELDQQTLSSLGVTEGAAAGGTGAGAGASGATTPGATTPGATTPGASGAGAGSGAAGSTNK